MTDRPDTDTPVTDLGGDVYDLTLTREAARYRAYLFDSTVSDQTTQSMYELPQYLNTENNINTFYSGFIRRM